MQYRYKFNFAKMSQHFIHYRENVSIIEAMYRVTQFKFLFKLCLTLSRSRSLSYRTDLFCKSNELFFLFVFFFMIGPSVLKELKHYNSPRNILKIFGKYILWKTMGDASITDWLSIKYHLTHILFLSRF